MRSVKQVPGKHRAVSDSPEAVDAFMSTLDHPCKPEIEALRKIIRGAHPDIAEGIKWNAPSFRTTEYFATTHLRAMVALGDLKEIRARKAALEDIVRQWISRL